MGGAYFRLYFQFIKHAFGLRYHPLAQHPVKLKIFFDEFPETKAAIKKFKGHILNLKDDYHIKRSGLTIRANDITEVRSHDHVLAQCLDIVLGAMAFRLNDKHKQIPIGQGRRGKKTIAKEKLYKAILRDIGKIRSGFNVGVSTGSDGDPANRWHAPYRHWNFVPSEMEYQEKLTKRKKKNGPT